MEKTNIKNVYKLDNGYYCYRLVINRKNLKVDTTGRLNENREPFKNKSEAKKALDKKKIDYENNKIETKKDKRYKLQEIYDMYMNGEAKGKAYATIKKQESMWENHIKKRFGNEYVDNISGGDLQDYLTELYTYGDIGQTYSYKYVEGFLKFFYLLFAQAYKHNCYNTEEYTKCFIVKNTRLTMPKINQEDFERYNDIRILDEKEIDIIYNEIKGSNFEIAFMIALYTGARLSEVYGLMWNDINFSKNILTINKQMLYENGIWCLKPVKTLQAIRTINMNTTLTKLLFIEKNRQLEEKEKDSWRATEKIIDKTKKESKTIIGGNFINRKINGELCTPNSVKYWTRLLKDKYNIDFNFHMLRKTFLTAMANKNTPLLEFQLLAGHKKITTSQQYYINSNILSREQVKKNINELYIPKVKKEQGDIERFTITQRDKFK